MWFPPVETHVFAPQAVEPLGYRQAPVSMPLHVAPHVVPTPTPEQALRVPCGDPVTAEHVPTLPLASHAAHCAPQAVSQQTPSTQKPEPHSALVEHATPFGFAQVPAEPDTLHF